MSLGERNIQEGQQLRDRVSRMSVRDSGQADSRCLTIEHPERAQRRQSRTWLVPSLTLVTSSTS